MENNKIYLSGGRQKSYLVAVRRDKLSGGRQINILYYISFVSPTGFRNFQHELDQKIYFQVYQVQTIYFYLQQNFEKAKKKKKKNRHKKTQGEGGGGVRMLVQNGAKTRTGFSMGFIFYFCTLPGSVCACAYIL